jgi:hypothetical protein
VRERSTEKEEREGSRGKKREKGGTGQRKLGTKEVAAVSTVAVEKK